jgi:hypothetical protein
VFFRRQLERAALVVGHPPLQQVRHFPFTLFNPALPRQGVSLLHRTHCERSAFRQARRYFPTMSYTGTVEGGVVKLPSEAAWPDGTRVRIESLESQADRQPLVEKLRAIARSMPDMPADWAEQHDHYIHGTPKRARP